LVLVRVALALSALLGTTGTSPPGGTVEVT
jgi:hypothetical protein